MFFKMAGVRAHPIMPKKTSQYSKILTISGFGCLELESTTSVGFVVEDMDAIHCPISTKASDTFKIWNVMLNNIDAN